MPRRRLEKVSKESRKQNQSLQKLVSEMAVRIQGLERGLQAEQETSLKALEALMGSPVP